MGTHRDADTEIFKKMIMETNPILLGVTAVVSVLHTVFDCLAFKNDIAFWKKKRGMKGLSARTILINVFCQVPALVSTVVVILVVISRRCLCRR
jgi:uncharacterized membrane protein YqhA